MSQTTFPVIFAGHGSPMMALETTDVTQSFSRLGEQILKEYGTPKAILMISAHWFTHGTYIQSAAVPKQIYDMYGFPQELYEVNYPVKGSASLTNAVLNLLGKDISINDAWGIDHGAWTVLLHMFPDASIPVVQLSVNHDLSPQASYELGQKLMPLRQAGYLIMGSGNTVHNLREADWDNPGGTAATHRFNDYIIDAVTSGHYEPVIGYTAHHDASYAVPTPDHFLPLLYCLGAAGTDNAVAFNTTCSLGSIAMTGFTFGM